MSGVLILHLAGLAASDDPAIVAEFQDKSYVVKYDKENGVVGIVEPDAEMPITGFPKPPSTAVPRSFWGFESRFVAGVAM
jgi:hypothetical protein